MITEYQQELASLHALGALTIQESKVFEADLAGNPELRELVHDLESTIGLVALSQDQSSLPSGLKSRVMQHIDDFQNSGNRRPKNPLQEPVLSILTAVLDTGWKSLPIPGTYIKLLSHEPERGYAVLLGKLDPGARYPAHINAGPEDFYILTGDLFIGDRKLVAGDFHHADAGSQHEENYSLQGCTLLAVLTTSDPLVSFAMA